MKKQTIIKLLKDKQVKTKATAIELMSEIRFLALIIKNGNNGTIMANNNAFWSDSNTNNRLTLANDLSKVTKFKITDHYYFHILNRFENGDHYGMTYARPTEQVEKDEPFSKNSKNNFEYRYNETIESEDFGHFIVLSQSYDFVRLDTEESREVFNVAIEYIVDETYSETIDLFESFEQAQADAFYDNLVKNIKKVGKLQW